jgi:hypothetical protein
MVSVRYVSNVNPSLSTLDARHLGHLPSTNARHGESDETDNLYIIPQLQHHSNFYCGVITQYS